MKVQKSIIIVIIIVILNGIYEYFYFAKGSQITPLIIIFTTSIFTFGTDNLKSIQRVLLSFLTIVLNGFLIQFLSIQKYLFEDLKWIHLFDYLSIFFAFLILLVFIIRDKKESSLTKIIALLTFLLLIIIYYYFNFKIEREILL
jgi:hypothetical protein